jgi:hypothetical protein
MKYELKAGLLGRAVLGVGSWRSYGPETIIFY